MCTQEFFGFPSGFIFRVITPLNFIEFEGSITGCALLLVEDLYWLFGVCEIGLELVILFQDFVNGWFETPL